MKHPSDNGGPKASVPRWVFAALLLVAIGYQTFENIRSDRFYLTPDKMHHILSSQAFLKGFGMSHLLANPEDPGELVVEPHTLWSTGYSLLLAGVLSISGDLYQALALVDLFSTILFFASWWLMTPLLEPLIGAAGRLFLLGWWALVHSPLSTSTMDASGSSDMLSIGLFSMGIWLSTRMLNGHRDLAWAAVSGVCFGAAAGVRYAYWPLIVAGPAAFLAISLGQGMGRIRQAVAQLGVASVFVFSVILLQPSGASHTIHDSVERGFHWGQLSTIFPFPANAVGIVSAIRSASGHFPGSVLAASAIPALIWVVSVAILGGALWGATGYLRGYFGSRELNFRSAVPALVVLTTAAAMAITVAMLCYLTIRIPADGTWTYGSMPRYFMPTEMFLMLGLAAAFQRVWNRPEHTTNRGARMAAAGVLAVLAAGPVAHRIGRIDAMARGVHAKSAFTLELRAFERKIPELAKQELPVVYADSRYERVLMAGVAGARMLQLNGREDVPALSSAEVILATSVSKGGAASPPSAMAEEMLKRGARTVGGGESFDLLVLDLSTRRE